MHRVTLKYFMLLHRLFHCQFNQFPLLVFILSMSKCSWSILIFTLSTGRASQTTRKKFRKQWISTLKTEVQISYSWLSLRIFSDTCSTVELSITVEQTHRCCAALASSSKLDHSKGTEQRFFPAESAGYPMSHGSQCWQGIGCRHKQAAQISSNERQ